MNSKKAAETCGQIQNAQAGESPVTKVPACPTSHLGTLSSLVVMEGAYAKLADRHFQSRYRSNIWTVDARLGARLGSIFRPANCV
jgi:hypothetical protein